MHQSLPVRSRIRTEQFARISRHISEAMYPVRHPTGCPEEGGVTKGTGELTSGDGTSAGCLHQSPPLEEVLEGSPALPVILYIGFGGRTHQVIHAAAWRKRQRTMTGEYSTSPNRLVNPSYKPLVKRNGRRDGTGKESSSAPVSGIAAESE